jgi:glycosyltransferase involved in cell wall biosynthesis
MNIVLFCHPNFLGSQSMPRFANMLTEAYTLAGHNVVQWAPKARLHKLFGRFPSLAKWAGYIDQYLLFPIEIKLRLAKQPLDTLYVFCDQALGPWVPLVKHLPHVVHAHDLLALRSALGLIPENPTSQSGKLYQKFIRRGFRQAKVFICVSNRTREDLHEYGGVPLEKCEVVYNGFNYPYQPMAYRDAVAALCHAGLPADPEQAMLLHVGGNQWYKNTDGLIHLYANYAKQNLKPLPLWLISPPPNEKIGAALATVPPQGQVLFFKGLSNHALQAAYSRAEAFIFPSLEEGFGWPIAEALSCGCPVLTTDEAPMTEVGGNAAYYLRRRDNSEQVDTWAASGAKLLQSILDRPPADREERRQAGLHWALRFQATRTISAYLRIYERELTH